MQSEAEATRKRVQERYTSVARGGACCGPSSGDADYTSDELAVIPPEAILGLGSGNPVRHAGLQRGEVVVDLGSGAGIDVFLAANQVGAEGRAIGIDMTPAMLERARAAAEQRGLSNVEFHQAEIEQLPLGDSAADVVLSNCVINLSPDKAAVFREAFRVLKTGGRLVVSDLVQERPLGDLQDDCGCVANAMLRVEYLETIRRAGFADLTVLDDRPWQSGPEGIEASAITLRAIKR